MDPTLPSSSSSVPPFAPITKTGVDEDARRGVQDSWRPGCTRYESEALHVIDACQLQSGHRGTNGRGEEFFCFSFKRCLGVGSFFSRRNSSIRRRTSSRQQFLRAGRAKDKRKSIAIIICLSLTCSVRSHTHIHTDQSEGSR